MSSEPIRVLLVEDNVGDARLLFESLQEAFPEQFQISHDRRLSEALEHLWVETYDVVLLDLGLPDSHGLDTLILTRAQAPGVPIVVLTGFQDETMEIEALKAGAQDYLVKGQADGALLASTIRHAMARRVAEDALLRQGLAVAKAEELQRSRQRLIAVQERARRDIAAQLQEGVQAKLLLLKGHLQAFSKEISPPSEASGLLREAIDGLTQEIEQQVGVLSRQLYPAILSRGLVPTFQSLMDPFAGLVAIELELDPELTRREQADSGSVLAQVGLTVYRIAEEALANVVKHSHASQVTIRLDPPRAGWLRLTVRDNGDGFDVKSTPLGLGIATMRDYAEAEGGECVVQSSPGGGTAVTAILPLVRPSAAALREGERERKETSLGHGSSELPLVQ